MPMAPPGRPGPARRPRTAGADTRPTPGRAVIFRPLSPPCPRPEILRKWVTNRLSFGELTEGRKKNTANSAASRPQTGADPPFRLCSRGAARPARDPPQDTNDPLIAMTCLKDLNVGDLTDVGMRGIPPQASLARLVSIQPLPWPATNHAECRPMHAVGRSS